ncbi:MAG: hypothetical protein EPN33_05825 [Acidobacteria bacterium]|nr:MAG: hypothetical protein EPN33_05825 [Acidobacteriota bacterium]
MARWDAFPPALRRHLMERMRERGIGLEDLYELMHWVRSAPLVPDGDWYKDFGTFKLCGNGALPKTFLLPGQIAKGQKL